MNVVVLIGRLVADPELRYTPSGVAVCSFRIAVDRWAKSETGEKEADFIDIVAWRHSAEYAANYLTKGQRVAVNGRLQVRSWVQPDGHAGAAPPPKQEEGPLSFSTGQLESMDSASASTAEAS